MIFLPKSCLIVITAQITVEKADVDERKNLNFCDFIKQYMQHYRPHEYFWKIFNI